MCPSRETCLAAEYCFGELSLFWSSKYKADIIILYNVPCSRHDIDCSLALSKHHSLTMVHARCIAFTHETVATTSRHKGDMCTSSGPLSRKSSVLLSRETRLYFYNH
jgi:hypothetical protein